MTTILFSTFLVLELFVRPAHGQLFIPNEDVLCRTLDHEPFNFFGTKTTYTTALKFMQRNPKNITIPDKCSPQMIYMFKRHAIRYPDGKDIPLMKKTLENLRDHILRESKSGSVKLCKQDIEAFQKWQLNMRPEDDNSITESGSVETASIAKRLRERFPDLMNPMKRDFDIAVSNRIRTTQTAESFLKEIEAFYGHKDPFDINVEDVSDFHAICEDHLAKQGVVLTKPRAIDNFINGELMKSVTESVSKRIGLNYTISWKQLKIIYRGCSFGDAIFGDDTWCAVFSKDDLKVLEYYEDLDDFYADGYGRSLNTIAPCLTSSDLIKSIEKSIDRPKNSETKPVTYLRFSHAGAMKQLVSHFGLFSNFPSTWTSLNDNECLSQSGGHNAQTWRSSLIAPFSCNFQFVLYKCNSEEDPKYHLVTYLQEFPVLINGCDDEFCPLNQFLSEYQVSHMSPHFSADKGCDLERVCRI